MQLAKLFFILCWAAAPALAADWPCWRGPDGLGISSEKHLPISWSKQSNILWTAEIPGKGVSSPIVVGTRAFLTTQTPDTGLHVLAINRDDGKILWDREVAAGSRHANKLHNMATPTAVSDGQSVWAMFGTGDIACLGQEGKIVWQRNLMSEYGGCKSGHGYGSSPMLLDGILYVALMHQGPSYLLAMDSRTGTNLWKQDRNLEPRDEAQDSYSSPFILRASGSSQLVLAGAESINGYDSVTGRQLWTHGGLKVTHHFGRTISGPAAGEGMILAVASGYQNQGYTVALKTGAVGTVPESARAWTCRKFSPDCPTPIIYEGKVFMIRDDGMASCLNLQTGEPHWQERLFDANVKVSPVAGDGKVFFTSGQGNCLVLRASSRLEILSTNDLSEATLSSPSISNGHLFFRTDRHLLCVGK